MIFVLYSAFDIAELMEQYKLHMTKKKDLENQVSLCEQQSERAKKLLGGLSVEKERWSEAAFALDVSNHTMPGDVLLSAGIITYSGAFTGTYRQQCYNAWCMIMKSNKIPYSPDFALAKTFSDPVIIRSWQLCGMNVMINNNEKYDRKCCVCC